MRDGLHVELGGGANPRGAPWLNVDLRPGPGVDHAVDLEALAPAGPGRLPFADGSVAAVCSSHCLEHVANLKGVLWEVARVCREGATFELRVPHWLSPMALCHGHRQVIPPEQVDHWCRSAVPFWWAGSPRRLAHVRTEQVPGGAFAEAAGLFPHLGAEQLMRFCPGAAHEVAYFLEVVRNDLC